MKDKRMVRQRQTRQESKSIFKERQTIAKQGKTKTSSPPKE